MPEIKRGTLHWVPVDQVITPPRNAHLLHMADMWWATNENGEVLLFRGRDGYDTAQANRNRSLTERLISLPAYRDAGANGVLHIEHAFLPDSPGRY